MRIKQYPFPAVPASWLGPMSNGPFDFVGVSKRASKDVKRIELFLRAAYEGVNRRLGDAFANIESNPEATRQYFLEARSLAVQSSQLVIDYIEVGENTFRKLSLSSVWAFLTRQKDPDIFKAHRERARAIAVEFGFPLDVQKELGVTVGQPTPL